MNIPSIATKGTNFVVKHSPVILTTVGCVGVVGTAIFAGEARLKAQYIVDALHEEHASQGRLEPTKSEIIKAAFKVYIPTIAMGGLTIAAIIGANSINAKQKAVLAGLYSMSEIALKEYQAKVIEHIGDKKEVRIREDIAKERMEKNPAGKSQVIITGKGDSLCYDAVFGNYFRTNIEKVRAAVNTINAELISSMWCSLNEFYYELGIPPIMYGDEVGWNIDNRLDVSFSSHINTEGEPCLCISYHVISKLRDWYKS